MREHVRCPDEDCAECESIVSRAYHELRGRDAVTATLFFLPYGCLSYTILVTKGIIFCIANWLAPNLRRLSVDRRRLFRRFCRLRGFFAAGREFLARVLAERLDGLDLRVR
jgi:hypothetical protein